MGPRISDILRTLKGSRQTTQAPGITRRDVLGSGLEQMMPQADSIEQMLADSATATDVFKAFPDLWNPAWGPLEEAEPEDIADALAMVLEGLSGGGL